MWGITILGRICNSSILGRICNSLIRGGISNSSIREMANREIYTIDIFRNRHMQFSNPHTKVAPVEVVASSTSMLAYERELTKPQFEELLKQNTGNVIIKFGATWCGPCKRIEAHVGQWFDLLTRASVQGLDKKNICIAVDVDDSFDLYGAFKSRRQVSGIPAILHFKQGNLSYIPDNSVVGADHEQVNEFFKRVSQ